MNTISDIAKYLFKSATKIGLLLFICGTVAGFFMRLITSEQFMLIASVVIGSYYGGNKGPITPVGGTQDTDQIKG